jgi:hypothetical protein
LHLFRCLDPNCPEHAEIVHQAHLVCLDALARHGWRPCPTTVKGWGLGMVWKVTAWVDRPVQLGFAMPAALAEVPFCLPAKPPTTWN